MTAFQNYVIVGGVRFPIDCKVRNWESTGLQFKAGQAANRKRKRDIDLAVIHWTAGENPATSTYKTLVTRGLGIEFVVDVDGVLWQMADPLEVDTADVGPFNPRSLGFEVTCYGYRKEGQKAPRERAERKEMIHGRPLLVASFLEAQKETLAVALKTLHATGLFRFELVAPAESMVAAYPRLLPARFVRSYQGVVGHFHLSEEKTDPGLEVFEWMFAKGHLSPVVVEETKSSPASSPSMSRKAKAPHQ